MLDERDEWRVMQFWFLRAFRERVHREFIKAAVLSRSLKKIGTDQYVMAPAKYEAARYKLRGWGWIDPAKEVSAYKEAIAAGITDLGTVIAHTAQGDDLEDVMTRVEAERELFREKGLTFDWMQQQQPAPVRAAKPKQPEPDDEDAAEPQRGVVASLKLKGKS
jgi:capsid protein